MHASTLLERTLGAARMRSLVNRGYHAYARHRMRVMAKAGHAPFWDDAVTFNQHLRALCESLSV